MKVCASGLANVNDFTNAPEGAVQVMRQEFVESASTAMFPSATEAMLVIAPSAECMTAMPRLVTDTASEACSARIALAMPAAL